MDSKPNPSDAKLTGKSPKSPAIKGRGASSNPANRFESVRLEKSLDACDLPPEENQQALPKLAEYFDDQSQTIVSENQSPDIGFRWSINPYRGCLHGCSYCYARPYHEYLGMSAGLDFETKIIVKRNAPLLLRQWLLQPSWRGERLAMSGVTDPYQPIEKELRITRQILEVLREAKNCVSIITKNALIARDIDILAEMAREQLAGVALSITTLDTSLAQSMEPRTSTPDARFRTVEELSKEKIPTHVNLAPIIPGLNCHEIPRLLERAAQAGATSAAMQVLRLPGAVEGIFLDWLEQHQPQAKERVLSRIRSVRNGKLNVADFGSRMMGEGAVAESLHQTFRVLAKKHGLSTSFPKLNETLFQPPASPDGQLRLF